MRRVGGTPAGERRHRIMIQQNTPTRGTAGGFVDAWTDVCECRAKMTSLSGVETHTGGQRSTRAGFEFNIRWQPGIRATMRIKYEDLKEENRTRYFNITDVSAIEELSRELSIMAEERNEGVSDKG